MAPAGLLSSLARQELKSSFFQYGDEDLGDFDEEPVILVVIGQVPEEVQQ